jgi:exoribonuclease II
VEATVLRENLCRFDALPLVARVPSLPRFGSGEGVLLEVSNVDLLELTFHCEFVSRLDALPSGDAGAAASLQASTAAS